METFLSVLATAGYVALCVFLFSLSIAIHEFGHFAAARRLGYRVERFSIGFGPAIWKWKRGGVEYRVSAIPFGGYVSIPDVDPEGTRALEGGGDAGPRAAMPPWKDLVVAFAGPAMNVVFAAGLAVLLYFAPGARFGVQPAVIDGIVSGGAAEAGGLREGDRILSIDGHPVETWSDVSREVQFAAGRSVEFAVERGGEGLSLSVAPVVKENGIAYIDAVHYGERRPAWMPARGVAAQIAWDAGAVFRALKGLVTPREMKATGNALGGPVMIAKSTYSTIRNDIWDGLGFLRFINTNLAVMNLLPIPVLDGGLILFSLLAIVMRRKVPEKITAPLTTAFMYLLVGLMLFLAGRDFFVIRRVSRPVECGPLREPPAAAPEPSAEGAP